jgi:hypothetical protein
MSKLGEIETMAKEHGMNHAHKLSSIRENILHLTTDNVNSGQASVTDSTRIRSQLKQSLDQLEKERMVCDERNKIIQSLYFTEIDTRWDQIMNAEKFTNEWLFDTSIKDWLREQDGYYMIHGKVSSRYRAAGGHI